jgi:hypothetical protein
LVIKIVIKLKWTNFTGIIIMNKSIKILSSLAIGLCLSAAAVTFTASAEENCNWVYSHTETYSGPGGNILTFYKIDSGSCNGKTNKMYNRRNSSWSYW